MEVSRDNRTRKRRNPIPIILSIVKINLTRLTPSYLLKRLNRKINRNTEKGKIVAILELAGATAH